MTLIWNDSAKEEVRKVYGNYFDYSPALADEWSDELDKKVSLLMDFPEMGRIVPDINVQSIREVFVRRHRLVYQFQSNELRIMAIRPMGHPLGKL